MLHYTEPKAAWTWRWI